MTDSAFNNYYAAQAQKGFGISPSFSRGNVFFRVHGTFGNIMSSVLNVAKPFLKRAGRFIGKKGLKFAGNVASDVLEGKNVGSSFKNNASRAFESTKDDMSAILKNKLQYSPNKRKNKKKKIHKRRGKSKNKSKVSGYL